MRRCSPVWTVILATLTAGACADRAESPEEAAATITEEDYRAKLQVIAHDSMMGRDTPSEGLEKTAAWIAEEFRDYGLEPGGGDGSYLQRWPYPGFAADWDATVVEVRGGPGLTLGEDLAYRGAPVQGEFTGDVVVLAGTAEGRNGMGDLDVEGRHVIAFAGDERTGRILGFRLDDAAGVFVVSDVEDDAWAALVEDARDDLSRMYGTDAEIGDGPPSFTIRRSAAEALLESAGVPVPDPSGALRSVGVVPGVTIAVQASARQVDDASPPNVVGVLPGSDPELSDQYVVFSAHMDHVGVNPARARQDSVFDIDGRFVRMETDSIFNGADDDASGTIAIVEVAEAFSTLATPPRRSMVFLLVSGEEKGLLGSRWFAENPTVPLEDIVANVNADMVGRNWSDTVVVIGKEHSELGRIMNDVGTRHPELDMAPIDDRWPEENFYRRSDHFNFARRGVPVLFFFTGVHEDYHQATDEVRKVDTEKASRIAKLAFYLAHEVGNRAEPPRWYEDSYEEYVTQAPEGAPERTMPRGR